MNFSVTEKVIIDIIISIRNEKVIIDKDLAKLYQVETKVFNQAVKRNLSKFEGFMFQLTDTEKVELVTNCDRFYSLKHSSSNPYAFTEHGVLMAASILNSPVAIEVNRRLIKAFVYLRKQVFEHNDLKILKEQIRRIESENSVDKKIVSDKLQKVSQKVNQLSDVLNEFQSSHIVLKRPVNQGDPQQEMN